MRRADRLFQIVQRLRRRNAVVTAADLARELEVSERTIYRDIGGLVATGVPIEGEAGVGYRLPRGGFDLPPLMFGEDEIEALVLGARVVKSWGDPGLARAAEDLLAKVEAVLPPRLQSRVAGATLFAMKQRGQKQVADRLGTLRSAIRTRRKVELEYVDRAAQATTRTVWPLGLFYWGVTWTLGAWEPSTAASVAKLLAVRTVGAGPELAPGSGCRRSRLLTPNPITSDKVIVASPGF